MSSKMKPTTTATDELTPREWRIIGYAWLGTGFTAGVLMAFFKGWRFGLSSALCAVMISGTFFSRSSIEQQRQRLHPIDLDRQD